MKKYKSSYLIRLDDAHSKMDLSKWKLVETILIRHKIKPLVAVIPNNRDRTLVFGEEIEDFWGMVRRWQFMGWTIGMHGYSHLYESDCKGFFGYRSKSEFAGLSLSQQKDKIKKSVEVFYSNGIKPKVFVAPGHTLDDNTLKALEMETEIRIISDGFSFRPYVYKGFLFVPAQMWRFRRMPFGVWTIILHPSSMSKNDLADWDEILCKYGDKFISFEDVVVNFIPKKKNKVDKAFEVVWLELIRIRKGVRKV